MSIKIIKKNKKTMIVNTLVTITVCYFGWLFVEGLDLPGLTYIAVGMLASAIELEIK